MKEVIGFLMIVVPMVAMLIAMVAHYGWPMVWLLVGFVSVAVGTFMCGLAEDVFCDDKAPEEGER